MSWDSFQMWCSQTDHCLSSVLTNGLILTSCFLAWLHSPSLYYIIFRSLSIFLSLFLPFCHLSFSITHTECILSSTGSVLKIYSLSQKSYETLLSEYRGSVLALIKANNVNFKRWWSNVWWNCQKVVAALLCVLKLSFSCWRFFFLLFLALVL